MPSLAEGCKCTRWHHFFSTWRDQFGRGTIFAGRIASLLVEAEHGAPALPKAHNFDVIGSSWRSRLPLPHSHPVPDPRLGEYVPGVLGVVPQHAAQSLHHVPQQPALVHPFRPPALDNGFGQYSTTSRALTGFQAESRVESSGIRPPSGLNDVDTASGEDPIKERLSRSSLDRTP